MKKIAILLVIVLLATSFPAFSLASEGGVSEMFNEEESDPIELIPSESIALNRTDETLGIRETLQLQAILSPSDTTDAVVWSSSDYSVVAVSNTGLVTALAEGEATITAITTSGRFARCTVQVVPAKTFDVNLSELGGNAEVYVDGKQYFTDEFGHLSLAETTAQTAVYYTYNKKSDNPHEIYPTGMKVYKLTYSGSAYSAVRITELDNCLQYAGTSIRLTGKNGIRIITGVPERVKQSLIRQGGLGGYELEEYGTIVMFTSKLTDSNPLVLGAPDSISNYAYKKGVSDPIYKRGDGLLKYTNAIVGFSNAQCRPDLSLRPYMVINDTNTGTSFVVYGGIVQRSIQYIAEQNKDEFAEGTDAYNYIWSLING